MYLRLICLIWGIGFTSPHFGQGCVRIEALLVDACGSPEGENEMIRFRTGSQWLMSNQLQVNWPLNSWLGVCQDVQTASKVSQINAGITGCGLVLEPLNGLLPPFSQVVLVTSTLFNPNFNPFTHLNDTVYIIFQCSGNSQGHLANATSTGLRTIGLSFSQPLGCSHSVTYDCQMLTDIYGNTGTVGNSASERDGASVMYPIGASPIYYNLGCSAPYIPFHLGISSSASASGVCVGDTLWLSAQGSQAIQSIQWTGGNGVFIQPQQWTTGYVVSALDSGLLILGVSGTHCNGTIQALDTFQVNVFPAGGFLVNGPLGYCAPNPTSLFFSGSGLVSWNTGATGAVLQVNSPGWYTATLSNVCGSIVDSIEVIAGLAPSVFIQYSGPDTLCVGQSALLQAIGQSSLAYVWSNGFMGSVQAVSQTGWQTVSQSNGCGVGSDSIYLVFNALPFATVVGGKNQTVCVGDSILLQATGTGTLQWQGQPGSSIWVKSAGVYVFRAENQCGFFEDTVLVQVLDRPQLAISTDSRNQICLDEPAVLRVDSDGILVWNTGLIGSVLYVYVPGNYFVTSMNVCGKDTLFFNVVSSSLWVSLQGSPVQAMAPVELSLFPEWSNNAVNAWWNIPGEIPIFGDTTLLYFEDPGEYTFVLSAEDSSGCIKQSSVTLRVLPDPRFDFWIPSAFSPNEDLINDFFRPRYRNIAGFSGVVLDRWGIEIFVFENRDSRWDGKMFDGSLAPLGSYVYHFEVKNMTGDIFPYSGRIVLLR
jgi:gliding motility-associated-like protein